MSLFGANISTVREGAVQVLLPYARPSVRVTRVGCLYIRDAWPPVLTHLLKSSPPCSTMPSLRFIAILTLLAASCVSSALASPIKRQKADMNLATELDGRALDSQAGPWLHVHCV